MKTTSKVFYTIGRVVNIIEIVLALLMLAVGILTIVNAPDIAERALKEGVTAIDSVKEAKMVGTAVTIGASIWTVLSIVIFCLANKASKTLDSRNKNNAPHVIMIVIGIFGDIFYLIGGIFGLLEESNKQAE